MGSQLGAASLESTGTKGTRGGEIVRQGKEERNGHTTCVNTGYSNAEADMYACVFVLLKM